ncbi:MAG: D-alanyl-D-alanine carboxypeptidase/D-alanyl-D-alanine-endopeptidase [Fimbriimonas sp.]
MIGLLGTVVLGLLRPIGPLDAILDDPKLAGATVSVCVTDRRGGVVYERNSAIHVVPASNQKLLSCAFALEKLGPAFRPVTRFWREPDRLVIDSTGDPMMTYAQLRDAATKLRANRDLPVALRQAYRPGIPGGWEHDDLPNRYAAPVTAFTFDQGAFELWAVNGTPTLLPEPFGVGITALPSSQELSVDYDPFRARVRVSGRVPREKKLLDTLALPNPDLAAASLFGSTVGVASEVPGRKADLEIKGSTVAEIVKACLPPSDNQIAEHLLLMAGGPDYSIARKNIAAFLETVGVAKGDVKIADGSGLSRHNALTTRAICQLLTWADRQPTAPIWRNALARPGVGTLRSRLAGIQFAGKTGSLDMVSSLSGYLSHPDGRQFAVSIVMNHYFCTSAESRAIQDRFVAALLK